MKNVRITILALAAVGLVLSGVPAGQAQGLTKAPAGEAGWVSLFNGKNLDGWHLKVKPNDDNQMSWAVLNGVLINVPPTEKGKHGIDLVSDVEVGSHELYIEFLLPVKDTNSGVYLMGDYEVQVLDSAAANPPTKTDCGGIYNLLAPTTNATKPVGEWQCYHAIFHAPKVENGKCVKKPTVTVYQNGTKVLDNAEIVELTGASLSKAMVAKGPTYLQGNHGAVFYRNIFYKPIEE